MPATDGVYSIGDDTRRWTRAIFYYLNSLSGLWALSRVGSRLPAGDPDYPGEACPHFDFAAVEGAGLDEYRIWQTPDDFTFRISRRVMGVGSWQDILKFNPYFDPVQWLFGASFLPTITNTFDFGADTYRWRDIFIYRYLSFFGFMALPPPTIFLRGNLTYNRPIGEADELIVCRRRTAEDYKWKDLVDSFESVSILKSVAGITRANIDTVAVEILGDAHRSKVDLTYMDGARVVFGGVNSEAVMFYAKIQYSTDLLVWNDLTPEAASDGTVNEQLVVGSWGNIPTGALADVYIRAMGRAENGTADPTYKSIELQIR